MFLGKHLSMESLMVSVTIPTCEEEKWVALLYECGATGVEVQNFEFDPVTLRAFFPASLSNDLPGLLNGLSNQLPESAKGSLTTLTLPHEDWEERWHRSLQPFSVGESFRVVPCAHVETKTGSRTRIYLEPGMAFGTGTHESTQLCLMALERLPLEDRLVMDIGTGAGILAIAAALRGARGVFACDTDPVAVGVAWKNFCRNQVAEKMKVWVGSLDALQNQSAEICFANLTAGIFEELWAEFERVLRPQGILICSGILQEQGDAFRERLRGRHFEIERMDCANEWVSFVAWKE